MNDINLQPPYKTQPEVNGVYVVGAHCKKQNTIV